jgi:hypothetical protein
MQFKLKCTWQPDGSIVNEHTRWLLRDAHGNAHAYAYRDDSFYKGGFVCWTRHTEGNDIFGTLAAAQAHAEKRLENMFAGIAPAFECEIQLPGKVENITVQTAIGGRSDIATDGTCLVCFCTNCLCDR